VLGTVKGDVHDIGKNLVDIILTNNGYKVVNLGIKVPLQTSWRGARAQGARHRHVRPAGEVHRRDAREPGGDDAPGRRRAVLLGGAALTRNYVEDGLRPAYACGRVAYARDAFDGLHLMDKVMGNDFEGYLGAIQSKRVGKSRNEKRVLGPGGPARLPARWTSPTPRPGRRARRRTSRCRCRPSGVRA
jgi:5-methyltetrahydrofolate--homocysteine methyltransferase